MIAELTNMMGLLDYRIYRWTISALNPHGNLSKSMGRAATVEL